MRCVASAVFVVWTSRSTIFALCYRSSLSQLAFAHSQLLESIQDEVDGSKEEEEVRELNAEQLRGYPAEPRRGQ